ncbi:hypothetical protein DNTS_003423 [Danionella cerebrum]|uniref:Uncharacterized protein n=1 Tax=Danionella cerebrum TaxID=2873325 RepID=A0A553PR95_9TELE|nr:hypothetical protein DNTS_003423 [Danionella translucida]
MRTRSRANNPRWRSQQLGPLQVQHQEKQRSLSNIHRLRSDLDPSLRVFDRLCLTLDLKGCQFVKYPKRGDTSLQNPAAEQHNGFRF